MLAIRLQRVGKRNNPSYRVVLTDTRRGPKSGGFLEILGSYNPQQKGSLQIKGERISHWIAAGAQPSDTVHNLLVKAEVIKKPKRHVVPPVKLVLEEEKEKSTETKEETVSVAEQAPKDVKNEGETEKAEESAPKEEKIEELASEEKPE